MTPEPRAAEHFHPLEVIPVFRRYPRTAARDIAYTFIWNGLFGVALYAVAVSTSGRLPSFHTFLVYLLVCNLVGYAIHALFSLGSWLGIDARFRQAGFVPKTAYYTVVPMIGVLAGFFAASLIVDVGFRSWFSSPGIFVSLTATSVIISVVLSVIFFWRERSAVADAALARERERAQRIERESMAANLRALQAQIEPHFLFNTLANVAGLIDPDPAKAKRMLESFNRFLRASLDATRRDATTLGEEAELIGAYLDVLEVRMGPRLRHRIDVAPELGGFELPPMLLQPIIENAIRHGLEPRVEGGEVAMTARREEGHVVIEIRDTGVGFSPATRGGLGLTNVRDRLRLLYGERGGLRIGDNAPRGTCVEIRLPA